MLYICKMRTVQVSELRKNIFEELQHLPVQVRKRNQPIAYLTPADPKRKPLIDLSAIADFSKTHGVQRFYLFGSILRDDFKESSDVDVMVDIGGPFSDILKMVKMRGELEILFGRKVDLVSKYNVEQGNVKPRFRDEILKTSSLVYDAT